MSDYALDEWNEYNNISNTIDEASWIGEDVDELSDVVAELTHRIANGDLSHQIF
jgi:hypothetical protein|tara:strand:+ start:1398 stop:1559 length:162 start_codon:yes stop_codon:yes gene_type:complete